MSPQKTWETLFKRFDPDRPAQDPKWRATRSKSPAEDIQHALSSPFEDPRVLLLGTTGTGKTTELWRIAEARASKDFVVFLDLERHFSEVMGDAPALQRINPWEVCFLAGMALIRAASDRLAFTFPETHLRDLASAWAKLAKATGTTATLAAAPQVDLAAVAKTMIVFASAAAPLAAGAAALPGAVPAGLKVLEAATSALKWALPIGTGEKKLPDQATEMQALLGCVNVLIGLVQKESCRVVFVLDGLDRIVDIDRAKTLFVESQMIARLACPVVVCGPFALRHNHMTAGIRQFSDIVFLMNEPVLLPDRPAAYGPGVDVLCDVFRRRVEDIGAVGIIPEQELRKLAYRSGGRGRDFIKLIREVAKIAYADDASMATTTIVDKALDKQRRLQEVGLHKGHIELLESIARDPKHTLPEHHLVPELLTYGSLLPYSNGSEWYYPHPLLTMNLVKVPG